MLFYCNSLARMRPKLHSLGSHYFQQAPLSESVASEAEASKHLSSETLLLDAVAAAAVAESQAEVD
jgi:hypothetical protein